LFGARGRRSVGAATSSAAIVPIHSKTTTGARGSRNWIPQQQPGGCGAGWRKTGIASGAADVFAIGFTQKRRQQLLDLGVGLFPLYGQVFGSMSSSVIIL